MLDFREVLKKEKGVKENDPLMFGCIKKNIIENQI